MNNALMQVATEDDIRGLYRAILSRDAESDSVVTIKANSGRTLGEHIIDMVNSAELDQTKRSRSPHQSPARNRPAKIDTDGTDEQLAALRAHVRSVWANYGTTEPYWSVLTSDTYRGTRIESGIEEQFYDSGAMDVGVFFNACASNNLNVPTSGRVLDFGCGVGRLAQHLSTKFDKYVGIDISAPHLALAAKRMNDIGRRNVSFQSLTDFIDASETYDCFFTVLVLQHNPPPVMADLLRLLLARLETGGVGYFQIPCELFNYEFDLSKYLKHLNGQGAMEMHALPQRVVFDIINSARCHVVEVVPCDRIGRIGHSYSFLVAK